MDYVFGQYELDTDSRTLRLSRGRVEVQDKVFDLLAYLIEHREGFVSPDEHLEALWPLRPDHRGLRIALADLPPCSTRAGSLARIEEDRSSECAIRSKAR